MFLASCSRADICHLKMFSNITATTLRKGTLVINILGIALFHSKANNSSAYSSAECWFFYLPCRLPWNMWWKFTKAFWWWPTFLSAAVKSALDSGHSFFLTIGFCLSGITIKFLMFLKDLLFYQSLKKYSNKTVCVPVLVLFPRTEAVTSKT